MAAEVETLSLRERIAEARITIEKEYADSDAQQERESRVTLKNEIANVLGVEIDAASIEIVEREPFAEVEGLRFTIVDSYGGLGVVKRCEQCGGEEIKQIFGVRDLAYAERHGLGWPHAGGECAKLNERKETKRRPTEDCLLEALRDYIAQHSYQGGLTD